MKAKKIEKNLTKCVDFEMISQCGTVTMAASPLLNFVSHALKA